MAVASKAEVMARDLMLTMVAVVAMTATMAEVVVEAIT